MHYPTLHPDIHRRLALRGIDAEASTEAFLAEIRVSVPPDLLWTLSGGSAVAVGMRRKFERAGSVLGDLAA